MGDTADGWDGESVEDADSTPAADGGSASPADASSTLAADGGSTPSADAPPADATYRNASASTEQRVTDLLDRMTLEEKVAQLGSVRADQVIDGSEVDRDDAEEFLSDGVGHLTRIGGEGGLSPEQAARATNELQRVLVEETRLGVPAIPHEECLSGYMGPEGTTFPQAIGLASTWDPELVASVTDSVREELRAIGTHHALSPLADVARDLRWGRTEETFGEDPYLVAELACAYVRGLQGEAAGDATTGGDDVESADDVDSSADVADSSADGEPVSATVKHFLGHGAGVGGKNRSAVDLPETVLRDVHGFPFEAAVREADVDGVMNAYHAIEGVPCAADEWLLTDLLRGEWGFDGTVVSDYFSVDYLRAEHGTAQNDREAGVAALRAGIDVELPATDCYETLADAVRDGECSETVVDEAARRMLTAKVEAGLLEDPYVDAEAAPDVFDADDRVALSREAARESVVLLENDGVLPLAGEDSGSAGAAGSDPDGATDDAPTGATDAASARAIDDVDSIAVVGPKADSRTGLLGDYAYAAHYPDAEDATNAVTPLRAFERRADADVRYAEGCTTTGSSREDFEAATDVAADADVTFAFVGARSAIEVSDLDQGVAEGETVPTSGEGCDVTDLSLPGVQGDLLRRLGETGTPLVVVVVSGRPHAIPWAAEHADAVVQAWLPGEQAGPALADVLLDGTDPGGRLPISIARSVGQLPVHYSRRPNADAESYVYDDGEPLWGFGHGESYAEFEYRDLEIDASSVEPHGTFEVAVTVENVADRPGSEVVQCYASAEASSRARPVQELVGFQRVALDGGESARVRIELSATQFAYHDRNDGLLVEGGPYELRVGRAAGAIEASERVEVTETATIPRHGRTYFAETSVEQ